MFLGKWASRIRRKTAAPGSADIRVIQDPKSPKSSRAGIPTVKRKKKGISGIIPASKFDKYLANIYRRGVVFGGTISPNLSTKTLTPTL